MCADCLTRGMCVCLLAGFCSYSNLSAFNQLIHMAFTFTLTVVYPSSPLKQSINQSKFNNGNQFCNIFTQF